MTYTLYLVRHGIAEPAARGGDADRRLATEGVRKMREIAKGLKRLEVAPDVILTSPLRRAQETAAILAAALAPDTSVELYPSLAPGQPAAETAAGLRSHSHASSLMLVGHQPDLGRLASYLLARADHLLEFAFRKGGVAAIETASLPPRQPGSLEWFLTPEQLRLLSRKGR